MVNKNCGIVIPVTHFAPLKFHEGIYLICIYLSIRESLESTSLMHYHV